jgi:hypothetical protein
MATTTHPNTYLGKHPIPYSLGFAYWMSQVTAERLGTLPYAVKLQLLFRVRVPWGGKGQNYFNLENR